MSALQGEEARPLDGVVAMTPREMQAARLNEPLPVAPFVAWCDQRIVHNRRSLNNYPAIPGGQLASPIDQLMHDIGWDLVNGTRLLRRWRHETRTGLAERAVIEEALWHADTDIYDIYPDLPPPTGINRLGQGRRMTDKQIIAAHVIYTRRGLSTRQVAALIWRQYGYKNADSCAGTLTRAWKSLGLPCRDVTEANIAAHLIHGMTSGGKVIPHYKRTLRITRHGQCDGRRADGERCPRAAKPGQTTCGYHHPAEMARRRAQIAQVNARGKNTLRWANRQEAQAA